MLILIGLTIQVILYKNEPSKVFEIPNSTQYYEDELSNCVYLSKYHIVANPPASPSEIRDLMINYYKEHKVEIESLKGFKTKLEDTSYSLFFYKEDWNFTRHWKPDLTYVEESEYVLDQIREFSNQRIGFLTFQPHNKDDINISILSNNETTEMYDIPHSELE